MKKTLIFGLMFLLLISSVLAVEPTQQFNKIFLNPFYRASMSLNTNYNYVVNINPPDGITNIKSAIITFKVYITPTVTFNLTVDGQHCNNPLYTVSTTFSGSGQGEITFDCSNRITQAGTYNLVLRPTQANTGAITGWLDLTYMNSPVGEIKLHGTEYIPGDLGKLFLQFLNSENQAVTNSECFLSVWYPNDTIFLNNTVMSKLQNASDGIYYKNFNVPSVSGVYPASAKCYKPLTFDITQFPSWAFDGFESNTWTGGTGWANDTNAIPNYGWDVEDTVPLATIVTNASPSGPCYNGTYCAKYTGSYGFIERGVRLPDGLTAINITFATKFKGFQNQETCEFWIFDGNWHKLDSYNLAGGYSNNVWYYKSQYLVASQYELDQGSILLGYYLSNAPSTGDECFVDQVNIEVIAPNVTISNNTQYEILRGSGEVHVSNLYTQLNSSLITPQQIWNYTTRNLTYYPETNATVISENIWNYTNRTLTYYPETITAESVWNYTTRNLTYYQDVTNYTRIDDTIYAVNVTLYNKIVNETDLVLELVNSLYNLTTIQISNVPGYVWNYTNRNLTYYEDKTNYTLINETVFNYYSSLFNAISLIPASVWQNSYRNLTYYPDMTNYTKLIEDTWNYSARYTHGTLI